MHCGADFDEPVDAGGGDLATALQDGDADDVLGVLEDSGVGPGAVGVVLALVALFTLPLVTPAGTTLLYLLAVVAVGYLASQRATVADAVERGAQLLVLAPFLLWLFAAISYGSVGVGKLIGPVLYAALALFAARQIRIRLDHQ